MSRSITANGLEIHFQEVPDEWNARVDAFWREVDEKRY